MTIETYEYQTEVKQLLDLVIHSLYSNKDIFLRELISNASDAIDKLRFEGITNKDLLTDSEWKIKLSFDAENKTIMVSDNGIGMSKEDIIENIGTIAHSGTKQFLSALKEKEIKDNPELIGQFGVGFYASFMVADKVDIISRKAGEESSYKWTSAGDGSYTIEEAEKESHGTDIVLYLKEEALDYANDWKLKEIVKSYSDFVEHPIVMDVTEEDKTEEETINSQKAIWLKSKNEITKEEHSEFYKHVSHDFNEPFETIHYSAEGSNEFKALLYIPAQRPADIFYQNYKGGLNLYVKRVFIMHDCKKIIPEYLRFLKGVVDSSDLPLNVSREILQEDRNLEKIKKSIAKKVLKTLKTMMTKDPERYREFFSNFGDVIKEGINYDFDNKDLIKELLMFETTATANDERISFKEYVEKMSDTQTEIYYVLGEDRKSIENSPKLEAFKEKGYEVFFMVSAVDEFIVPMMMEFDGKPLVSVESANLETSDDEKQQKEEKQTKYKDMFDKIKDFLKEDIEDVRLTNKLTQSISCLVDKEGAIPKNMEMMMKQMGQIVPEQKKILELNQSHPLVDKMGDIFSENPKGDKLEDYIFMIYNQALLADGQKVKDPRKFSNIVNEMMLNS